MKNSCYFFFKKKLKRGRRVCVRLSGWREPRGGVARIFPGGRLECLWHSCPWRGTASGPAGGLLKFVDMATEVARLRLQASDEGIAEPCKATV